MATKRAADSGGWIPRGVGAPATRALEQAGYTSLDQLSRVTEADLLKLHGMGPKALGVLREALRASGMGFAAHPAPSSR